MSTHAVILIAKGNHWLLGNLLIGNFPVFPVPIAGFSKTRLIPDVGIELAAEISCCLLKDTLRNVATYARQRSSRLIWLFAPVSHQDVAQRILQEVENGLDWELSPMPHFESLDSPNIGSYLSYALLHKTSPDMSVSLSLSLMCLDNVWIVSIMPGPLVHSLDMTPPMCPRRSSQRRRPSPVSSLVTSYQVNKHRHTHRYTDIHWQTW